MNTITLQETHAVNIAAIVTPDLLLIALPQLRVSKRNVRKTKSTPVTALAASIARVGLLQNLIVTACADGEHYDVVGGKRRLAAMKLLAQRKRLPKTFEVPCLVVPDASARTVSLTENVQRQAMSPADELEAWRALADEGRSVEEIAADFGVTPLVVKRRLKLANVSPRLLADYREGTVTLDHLMALAITDDHAVQEAAFYDSPDWERSPQALRERLTAREIDAGRDALAQFVGVAAYEAAGGPVRRDLFAEGDNGVYLGDGLLLDRLAQDKLAADAATVEAEGWAWVKTAPRLDYAELSAFRRADRVRRTPKAREAKRIAQLEARMRSVETALHAAEEAEDEAAAAALYDKGDRLGEALDAIDESLLVYAPETLALAGAFVTLGREGQVVVHRGLLCAADAKALRALDQHHQHEGDADAQDAPHDTKSGISEKLARRLSAHRTAALQAEVARHPAIALVAVVHQLALRVVCDGYGVSDSPVGIHVALQEGLDAHAPDLPQSPAAVGLREVRQAWAERLPEDAEALFAALLAFPQQELLSLLAVCVASTVSAITPREDAIPAEALAQAVGLDMHQWWTPTADGYFAHVSKTKAIEAVQAFAPEHAARLFKLKKTDIASEAERLATGTGWLPTMLQGQVQIEAEIAEA